MHIENNAIKISNTYPTYQKLTCGNVRKTEGTNLNERSGKIT